jgi:uncharacterized protein YndB with AHSA1/START domain
MPITSVSKDPEALTMTVVAEFPVTVQRLWDAYADPRQLEKFWGPVEWPATFSRHDFATGGRSDYYMTGPDGEKSAGYWKFLSVNPGTSFEVEDGFATEPGVENTDMPSMRMVFTFSATATGAQVSTTTHFPSAEALEQLLGMGMEEGMTSAMSQMDAVITDLASFAADRAVDAQILSDTQVRVSRVIRGTAQQVWDAHHDPELMKRWLLGPDGWAMTECEVAHEVGDSYRYWWKPTSADVPPEMAEGFGFDGELIDKLTNVREVTTEHMIGTDYPSTTNELTLTPVEGGTLLSIVITYPSAEVRDMVLATGMTDGMEASYARLENEVFAAA